MIAKLPRINYFKLFEWKDTSKDKDNIMIAIGTTQMKEPNTMTPS